MHHNMTKEAMTNQPTRTPTPEEYGYTYDGSSEWSIGPKAETQVDPICTVWDRNDDRAKAKVMLIVNALNAYAALQAENAELRYAGQAMRDTLDNFGDSAEVQRVIEQWDQALTRPPEVNGKVIEEVTAMPTQPSQKPTLKVQFKNTPFTLNEYYEINQGLDTLCIVEKTDYDLSSERFRGIDEKNAAHIVKCVNAYAPMVETIKALLSELRWTTKNGEFPGMDKVIADAEQALRAAEGGK